MKNKKVESPAPDPFWPPGVSASHLKGEIAAQFEQVVGKPAWQCIKCGAITGKAPSSKDFCIDCVDKEARNSSLARKVNSSWMEQAAEIGLALYERQPEETDNEWFIWCKYREYYPRKMPTWTELAQECGMSVGTVVQASQRWSFKVRIVAWARVTDDTIQEERIVAIKEMNQRQLSMAQTIQNKLQDAIANIDPLTLKPGEIVNLFKVATELERRVTTYVDEKVDTAVAENRAKQVSTTKPEDVSAVLSILQKAGVLEGKAIGIEQTTTRLIAKEVEDAT